MHSNIDDNYEMLKNKYCLVIGKRVDEVMCSNRTCIKTSKIIIQDEETLSMCKHMSREMSIKHDRTIDDHKHVPMIEIETIDDNANAMNEGEVKIEILFKPHINVSTRRERE